MNRILALCAVALSSLALLVSLGRSQNTAVAAPNAATPTSLGVLGPAVKLLLTASEGVPLSIVS